MQNGPIIARRSIQLRRRVVSDLVMPKMNGVELATVIEQRWPAIPVLLVSGQGGPLSDYPGAFLGKPFTPDALIASVEEVLGSLPLRSLKQ